MEQRSETDDFWGIRRLIAGARNLKNLRYAVTHCRETYDGVTANFSRQASTIRLPKRLEANNQSHTGKNVVLDNKTKLYN